MYFGFDKNEGTPNLPLTKTYEDAILEERSCDPYVEPPPRPPRQSRGGASLRAEAARSGAVGHGLAAASRPLSTEEANESMKLNELNNE